MASFPDGGGGSPEANRTVRGGDRGRLGVGLAPRPPGPRSVCRLEGTGPPAHGAGAPALRTNAGAEWPKFVRGAPTAEFGASTALKPERRRSDACALAPALPRGIGIRRAAQLGPTRKYVDFTVNCDSLTGQQIPQVPPVRYKFKGAKTAAAPAPAGGSG